MADTEFKEKSKARIVELLIESRKKLYKDLHKIKSQIDELEEIIKSVVRPN